MVSTSSQKVCLYCWK